MVFNEAFNIISVISRRQLAYSGIFWVHLCKAACLEEGHFNRKKKNPWDPVGLDSGASRSRIPHFTNKPLRRANIVLYKDTMENGAIEDIVGKKV